MPRIGLNLSKPNLAAMTPRTAKSSASPGSRASAIRKNATPKAQRSSPSRKKPPMKRSKVSFFRRDIPAVTIIAALPLKNREDIERVLERKPAWAVDKPLRDYLAGASNVHEAKELLGKLSSSEPNVTIYAWDETQNGPTELSDDVELVGRDAHDIVYIMGAPATLNKDTKEYMKNPSEPVNIANMMAKCKSISVGKVHEMECNGKKYVSAPQYGESKGKGKGKGKGAPTSSPLSSSSDGSGSSSTSTIDASESNMSDGSDQDIISKPSTKPSFRNAKGRPTVGHRKGGPSHSHSTHKQRSTTQACQGLNPVPICNVQ
eukprot:Opistho-2@49156